MPPPVPIETRVLPNPPRGVNVAPGLDDAEWLREQYVTLRRSSMQIASEVGVTAASVARALRRHGITVRPGVVAPALAAFTNRQVRTVLAATGSVRKAAAALGVVEVTLRTDMDRRGIDLPRREVVPAWTREPRLLDREWLRRQTVEAEMSAVAVAAVLGCPRHWVDQARTHWGIKGRRGGSVGPSAAVRLTDRAWLWEQYVVRGRTLASIAAGVGVSAETVARRVRGHGMIVTDRRIGSPVKPALPARAGSRRRLSAAIQESNAGRVVAAAGRGVEEAVGRLRDPCGLTPVAVRVLRARVDHPTASLAQIAGTLGMTKDAYAAALRRALRVQVGVR
jgi:DNA-binding phage protein